MEGILEVLANHRIHHMFPVDFLLNVETIRPLPHSKDLLFDCLVLYLAVGERFVLDDFLEEVEGYFDLPEFDMLK